MLKYIKLVFEIAGQLLSKIWIWAMIAVIVYVILFGGVDLYRDIHKEVDVKNEKEIEYEVQNTISFAVNKIDTLNPVLSKSGDTYFIGKLVFDSLFEYDENLMPEPLLVKGYSVNTEKAFIECNLKKGIKFSDESKLTASDVEHTVNLIKTSPKGSPYYAIGKKIISFRRMGEYRFRIYFNNNYNCSLDDLVFPIMSASQNVKASLPVGTGRYLYKSYDSGKRLRLVPNKKHHGALAKNSLVFNIVPKKADIYNLMQIGDITCCIESGDDRKSEAVDKGFEIYDFTSNRVDFVFLNNKNPHLKKKLFRHAVNYCIDKKTILEKSYMSDGILTDSIYYPNYLGVEDKLDYYRYDIEKAKAVFSETGCADKDNDGYFDGIELRILVNEENPMRVSAAVRVKSGLRQAGVKSKIIKKKRAEYIKLIKKGGFDILITGYTMQEEYDLRSFFNGKAEWRYKNYKLSEAATELDRMHMSNEYKIYYKKLKDAIIDDASYSVLCYRKDSLIGIETFTAENMPVFNNVYKNAEAWSWKKRL